MSDRLTLPEVIDRFRAYHDKPGNEAWGSLHVVLDDLNLADKYVRACQQSAMENGDTEGAELADILLRLSKTQRRRINQLCRTAPGIGNTVHTVCTRHVATSLDSTGALRADEKEVLIAAERVGFEVGERVLLTSQNPAALNGVYAVTARGNGGEPLRLTREARGLSQ